MKHNLPPLRAPDPYFRQHIIPVSAGNAKSLIDTFNSKPYRFNFTPSKLSSLIVHNRIQVWSLASSPKLFVSNVVCNTNLIDKHIKAKLKPFSVITYQQHIHETPVPFPENLEIITGKEDKLFAIHKPAGVPVHGVQKYYHNTIHSILASQLKTCRETLFPLHRLDKVTTGILVWARDSETASKFKDKSGVWENRKIYIARIKGRIPHPRHKLVCRDNVVYIYPTRNMVKSYKGAETTFTELMYDEKINQSIVMAKLSSGYPHQIRIHLRNLNSPIIDDPLYGFDGKYREVLKNETDVTEDYLALLREREKKIKCNKIITQNECCKECGSLPYDNSDTSNHVICLHAWRYSWKGVAGGKYEGDHVVFETKDLPDWCPKSLLGLLEREI